MNRAPSLPDPGRNLTLYTQTAQRSAACVIREYSTSFGMATRLFDRGVRPEIRNIYGLVRIADEIVDGAASEAGLDVDAQREQLDALEQETESAVRIGYSTNLVVHSFAITARAAGIGADIIAPFFASMRRDLSPAPFTPEEVREYIYGSAEVVGLMCLRVLLKDHELSEGVRERLEQGACRLGAAFQKINFLRDLSADWQDLGRNYFPTIDPAHLTEAQKLELIADIDADLAEAASAIPLLPREGRPAIAAAHGLFSALTQQVRATPAEKLLRTRISVGNRAKLGIVLRTMSGRVVWSAV